LMTKSSDRISETLSGHTSRPYNNTGKHLLLIRRKVTSSDAILPILPKIAFAAFGALTFCAVLISFEVAGQEFG